MSLTRHVRRVHDTRYVPRKEREGENVECPVCNQVFLKSSLNTHLKVRPIPFIVLLFLLLCTTVKPRSNDPVGTARRFVITESLLDCFLSHTNDLGA